VIRTRTKLCGHHAAIRVKPHLEPVGIRFTTDEARERVRKFFHRLG